MNVKNATEAIFLPNEMLTFAIVWTDPENLLLSERSQTRKVTWYMIPRIKFQEQEDSVDIEN